jgi:hypothetical protein
MKILLTLLLSCCCALGATIVINPYSYSNGPAIFSPNNISGIQNLSWWVGDNIGTGGTNASGLISNWVDSGNSPIPLTNTGVTTSWPTISNAFLNGHKIVHFDGGDFLQNSNYVAGQPHEIVIYGIQRDPTNTVNPSSFFDSLSVNSRQSFNRGSAGLITAAAPTAATISATYNTNAWHVFDVLFNGSSSAIFVDNVSSGTKNMGTTNMSGLKIGATLAAFFGRVDMAEVVTYGASLGTVDSAGVFSVAVNRSNVFYYLTNKYTPPPFFPTNLMTTATNLSWWVADNITGTSTNLLSQATNWPDAGLTPLSLTNQNLALAPNISNAFLNGHTILNFNSNYLRNIAYTSTLPTEIVMVLAIKDTTNQDNQIIDSTTSAARGNFYSLSDGTAFLHSGTPSQQSMPATNVWGVLDIVFNGASSGVMFNMFSLHNPVTPGAQVPGGITIAGARTLGGLGKIAVAEIITYKGTLGAVPNSGVRSVPGTAVNREALWNYLTNKYASTSWPFTNVLKQ